MTHSAEYYESLAHRYEALANSMTIERDRETVASVAAHYRQRAAEARCAEQNAERAPQSLPDHLSIHFQP
jgi:hypothetical protein